MKKFLVGFALPAAAAIAVVGSGFSVWYFGDKEQSEDVASINVTELVKIGHFVQDSSSKIILDQTPEGRKTNGNGLGTDLEAQGVYMAGTDANWKGTIEYVTSNSDKVEGKVKTSIKTYIFLPKAVATYLNVSAGILEEKFDDFKLTVGVAASKTFSSSEYVRYAYTWGENVSKISLPKKYNDDSAFFNFTYKDTKEPTKEAEYDAMKTDVENKTVSIVSEAVLVKA